jgi:hypothetical protein
MMLFLTHLLMNQLRRKCHAHLVKWQKLPRSIAQDERASELLGFIHTGDCRPLNSRWFLVFYYFYRCHKYIWLHLFDEE